jgi:hypothetical protein
MFLSLVIWAKRTKFESEVVRCCPSLKKPANMAQEMQMGHPKWHNLGPVQRILFGRKAW